MKKPTLLFLFGTRPEAIKLAPIIKYFEQIEDFKVLVCSTGQHREMLKQVVDFFSLKIDFDLDLMKPDQSLIDISVDCMKGVDKVLKQNHVDLLFVQGDTTTVVYGALAAFYNKVAIAHVEAGLRSYNKYSPYPEEVNRTIVDHIADYYFAPTATAVDNLLKENITNHVYNVGNSVIDALFLALEIIKKQDEKIYMQRFSQLDLSKRIILVTCHRRESFGKPLENICDALSYLANKYPDVQIYYPVHLNPNVRSTVFNRLSNIPNIILDDPLDYANLVWLMNRSYLLLSDSGGIQEEGPSLGKPVLVLRDVTERTEGIEAGTAKLVGTDKAVIIRETERLLNDPDHYHTIANTVNPYGDGTTSRQMADIIKLEFLK